MIGETQRQNAWFYKSSKWIKCRNSFFKSKFGQCEQCGGAGEIVHHKVHLNTENVYDASISLNWDNLQLLCLACHNNVHFRKNNNVKGKIFFDENGDVMVRDKIIIVSGAPGSGKSTYVKNNMSYGDLVFDFDTIYMALSGQDMYKRPKGLMNIVMSVREHIFGLVQRGEGYWERAWIIASLPNKNVRDEMVKRFVNCKIVIMDTSRDECIRRVANDSRRNYNIKFWGDIIDNWFNEYDATKNDTGIIDISSNNKIVFDNDGNLIKKM